MKQSFFLILFFLVAIGQGQAQVHIGPITSDTSYYKTMSNGNQKEVPAKKADTFVVYFNENGYVIETKKLNISTGNLLEHKFYKKGRSSGKWLYYNEAGNVVRERDFRKLSYGPCLNLNKDSIPEGRTMPEFNGGERALMKYLGENIYYPEESRDSGTSGVVYMSFVIDSKGRVIPLNICSTGLDGYCDLVVWEIVAAMPPWQPGKQDGIEVNVIYYLPVSFKMR